MSMICDVLLECAEKIYKIFNFKLYCKNTIFILHMLVCMSWVYDIYINIGNAKLKESRQVNIDRKHKWVCAQAQAHAHTHTTIEFNEFV